MGDFPDPDEEYELMYSDDLELIREIDDGTGYLITFYYYYKSIDLRACPVIVI